MSGDGNLTQARVLALISDLRGGIPAACDFCGSPLSKDNEPVPEEGDSWAGYNCCWLRWEAEEKARRKGGS